jgi:hypothetical protein
MLTTERLLNKACEQTGLSHFGEPSFREPFEHLVASINSESHLTPLGAGIVEGALTGYLANRLQIEDWYRRHPEIDEQEIVRPIFITGLPRTGSTALGHMLATDPETRSLRTWEAEQPCPPPDIATATTDPRRAEANARYKAFEQLVPGLRDALPRDSNGPEECFYVLHLAMAAPAFNAWAHIPSFVRWSTGPSFDWAPAYAYHKRVLKLLQWRHPVKRSWVLRSPVHMLGIEALHVTYPDARFVMTHRDPVKSVPSLASLMNFMREVTLAEPQPKLLGRELSALWSEGLTRLLEFRDRIGPAHFFDHSHSRQVQDPAGQVAALYDWLGWHFDDAMHERLSAWTDQNPKGMHRPDASYFGLEPAELAPRFEFYTSRFRPCF